MTDYATYVIGKFADTTTWQGVPFTNVLDYPSSVYTEMGDAIQANWEASAMAGGQPITLASPITEGNLLNPGNAGGFSAFGNEVSNFLNSGYTWSGNLLTPP